jgi:hypothetical protein
VGDEIKKNEVAGACNADGGLGEVCTGIWWENLRERDHLGDPGIGGRIILCGSSGSGMWAGLIWLRIESGDRHL